MSSRKSQIAKTLKVILEVVEKRNIQGHSSWWANGFAIYGNFPKCFFRAVEVLEVGKNMQKMTFFKFQVAMGYG